MAEIEQHELFCKRTLFIFRYTSFCCQYRCSIRNEPVEFFTTIAAHFFGQIDSIFIHEVVVGSLQLSILQVFVFPCLFLKLKEFIHVNL